MDVEKIKARLSVNFIPYEEGEELRAELHEHALKNYKQKYTDADYLDFIERHQVSFEEVHPQSLNSVCYYQMFSVITQHIEGDCVKELLDIAIRIEQKKALKG